MSYYTATQAAKLLGISVYRLRIWEQRYRTSSPRRTTGGHRLYSREEIEHLSRLVRLVAQGHRISNLIALDDKQLDALLSESASRPGWPVLVVADPTKPKNVWRAIRELDRLLPEGTEIWILGLDTLPRRAKTRRPLRLVPSRSELRALLKARFLYKS